MKKHEEMKQTTMAYAEVADYVNTLIIDTKATEERYRALAMENESEKDFYNEQADLYLIKTKIYEVIYENLCKGGNK